MTIPAFMPNLSPVYVAQNPNLNKASSHQFGPLGPHSTKKVKYLDGVNTENTGHCPNSKEPEKFFHFCIIPALTQ